MFQGFESVVVPMNLYQLVLTMCHDLMDTMAQHNCMGT